MAAANGARTTVSSESRVTVGLLVTIAGLMMALIGGGAAICGKASAALPREEAYRNFMTKTEAAQITERRDKQLERIETKLDKLSEQLARDDR